MSNLLTGGSLHVPVWDNIEFWTSSELSRGNLNNKTVNVRTQIFLAAWDQKKKIIKMTLNSICLYIWLYQMLSHQVWCKVLE